MERRFCYLPAGARSKQAKARERRTPEAYVVSTLRMADDRERRDAPLIAPAALVDVAPGVIGAPHQRAGLHVAEAELFRLRFERVKFLRGDVAIHRKLVQRRLEILPDGDDIAVVAAQIAERGHHLVKSLPYAEHQS